MQQLRILFLTPRFPYPLIGGDRIKSYHLLKHLAEHHDVTLVTFNHGGLPTREQVENIEELGVRLFAIPLHPLKAALRCTSTFYSPMPLEIAFYNQPEFHEIVEKLLREEHFDLGISFFMRTAEYLRDSLIKKILIAEDCRVLYQSRSFKNSDRILQKIVRWWEVVKLKQYEPDVVNHFDITTLVTGIDIKAMEAQNSQAKYRLLTNGVELDEYAFVDKQEQRRDIMFIGNLSLLANEIMADKLVREILPIVRQTFPEVKAHLVGANPSMRIQQLASDSVLIHANVPDIQQYFHSSAIFLHPHGGATGIQNKVLQAMAMGCAVVSTPTGVQGIDARHGEDALIGNSSAELAEHCLTLLRDPALRSRVARNARSLIERTHSWQTVFDQLDGILDEVMAAPDPLPKYGRPVPK